MERLSNFVSKCLPITLVFSLLLGSLDTTAAEIGVCYGMLGGDLPPKPEVIQLYMQNNIRRMRIYGPDQNALQALGGSNIDLILDVPKEQIISIASDPSQASTWVRDNVQNYNNVNFRYIAVGNEIEPSFPEAGFIVQAMSNIRDALNSAGLQNIKVSTATFMQSLGKSYPPSQSFFDPNYRQKFLDSVIQFLVNNQSPLLVNVYPYFSHAQDQTIPLDYALFTAPTPRVSDPPSSYQNLFDAMVDAVYSALEKAGGGSLDIVVSETGWPTDGGVATSIDNAKTYNNNLIQHVKMGTPKRPRKALETYIFAMFDENQKTGPEVERHWGLFYPNKQPKYPVNFN